jgi:hypothetical protein
VWPPELEVVLTTSATSTGVEVLRVVSLMVAEQEPVAPGTSSPIEVPQLWSTAAEAGLDAATATTIPEVPMRMPAMTRPDHRCRRLGGR